MESVSVFRMLFPPYNNECAFEHDTYKRTTDCLFPGLAVEILNILISSMNHSFVNYRPNQTELTQHGSAFNVLFHRLAVTNDTCSEPMMRVSPERRQQYTMIKPMFSLNSVGMYFINSDLDDDISIFGFTRVFRPVTWLLFGSLALVFGALQMILTDQVISKRVTITKKVGKTWSVQLVALTSAFIALTASVYEGGLLANLIVTRESQLFTDYAGFVRAIDTGSKRLLVLNNSLFHDELQHSYSLRDLRQALLKHPPKLVHSSMDFQKEFIDNPSVYVRESSSISGQYLASKMATVRIVPLENLGRVVFSMMCSKNMSKIFKRDADLALHKSKFYMLGVVDRYRREFARLHEMRVDDHERSMKILRPLTLNKSIGVFTVVLFGLIFGLILLFIECCV